MMNPVRLRQARELSGFTQGEIAAALGVTQSTIAHLEGGRLQPTEDVLSALATHLGFPTAFFDRPDPPDFPLGSLLFRGHADLSASQKAEAHRYGELVFELFVTFSAQLRSKIALRLPQLGDEPYSAALAAQLTRDAFGLPPDTPIPHLMRLIEQSGVLAFSIPSALEGRDAYSLWTGATSLWSSTDVRRPVMILFGSRSGDRVRHSIGHELGHLVLHQSIHGATRVMEDEAHRFAQELLLPEVAMRQELVGPITLARLAVLKQRWGVSIQSLARRARDLGIISQRQYTYLHAKLAAQGEITHEPVDLPIEKPRGLRRMAELLYGDEKRGARIDYQRLSLDLALSPHFVRRLIEAHATREEFNAQTVSSNGRSSAFEKVRPLPPFSPSASVALDTADTAASKERHGP